MYRSQLIAMDIAMDSKHVLNHLKHNTVRMCAQISKYSVYDINEQCMLQSLMCMSTMMFSRSTLLSEIESESCLVMKYFAVLVFISFLKAWWRQKMETFSAMLAICGGIRRWPVNSPNKGQWRGALMFSLICVWINGWVNNGKAGDSRRYCAHYDVTVMACNVYSFILCTLGYIPIKTQTNPFASFKR